MFNNIAELKDFIIWAKNNKLESFKIKDIEVKISNLSMIEDIEVSPEVLKETIGDTLVDTEEMSKDELEELLFWSTKK